MGAGVLRLSLPDGSSCCCSPSLERWITNKCVLFWVSLCWLCPFVLFIPSAVPRVKSKCWRMDSVALSAGNCTLVGMAKVLHQLRHTLILVLLFGLCGIAELCQRFLRIHVQRMTGLLHTINSAVCIKDCQTSFAVPWIWTGMNWRTQQKSFKLQKHTFFLNKRCPMSHLVSRFFFFLKTS